MCQACVQAGPPESPIGGEAVHARPATPSRRDAECKYDPPISIKSPPVKAPPTKATHLGGAAPPNSRTAPHIESTPLGARCLVQGVWRRHLPRSRQPHPFQGGRTSRRSSRTMRARSEEWRRTSRRMSGCLTSSPPRSRHLGQHSLLYDRRRHLPRCPLQGAHA